MFKLVFAIQNAKAAKKRKRSTMSIHMFWGLFYASVHPCVLRMQPLFRDGEMSIQTPVAAMQGHKIALLSLEGLD